VNCPSCGTPNEPGRKFCGECGSRLAQTCAVCGSANGPGARFCGECGNPLVAGATAPAANAVPQSSATTAAPGASAVSGAAIAERRLVTVLFADLVGFTTLSEGRDPEEVRELLSSYFDLARDVISRYGGNVEKFIGDAVMAVWGAPIAHEDDAERCVRAALELVATVDALGPNIQARAGVLTGEAAVTLGAEGQGMVAGNLVNTASRLQSVAPPGSVLVGDTTQRAASGAITFEPVGDQVLKGKQSPVPAWRAIRVVAQRRGRGRDERLEAPFVGREAELRLLKDLFHATSREKRVRLVSITGVAGIGKSRLAWEFLKYVDGVVEKVRWHEGRSPAYGEGISFWALGEMIRSRADLVETDDDATTRDKVAKTVAEYVPDEAERRRIEPALNALLGVGEPPPGGAAELFGAWRTFFERLADKGTVAMLFEDLHWADTGMLDFIDHVLEWSRNVPILIITLARPDLLERRPDWGAGRRNFLALDLEPLNESQMRDLLAGLVPGLAPATVRSIVSRAEGIPLYAVETIRMLVSDGRLRESETGVGFEPAGELGELAVPESLHALIAARLDGLDPADRSLVQDASVLGQSFTLAGLSAVSGLDPSAVEQRARPLVRAELLRQMVDPRSPERGQFAFVQALIREVAYSTLALRDRRARHLAAARYFESLGEDELAGALASHYLAAWKATPTGPEADALASQARVALRAAADRASALGSPAQAVAFLEDALEVAADDVERAALLERATEAASASARSETAFGLIERAIALRDATSDRAAQARTRLIRGRAHFDARQREASLEQARATLRDFADLGEEHPTILELNALAAKSAIAIGDYAVAQEAAERAIVAAERLGLGRIAADVLTTKGVGLFYVGRLWESRALLEGARMLSEELGFPELALRATHNLGLTVGLDDPRRAVELERAGIELARRLGQRPMELTLLGNLSEDARRVGDWDWVIRELDEAIQLDVDDATRLALEGQRAYFSVYRGEIGGDRVEELVQRLIALEDQDIAASGYDLRTLVASVQGDWRPSIEALQRVIEISPLNAQYALPQLGQTAVRAGDVSVARQALRQISELGIRGRAVEADVVAVKAGIAALEGDMRTAIGGYRAAITAWRELDLAIDEAMTILAAATYLDPADPEVASWVDAARAIFTNARARPMLDLLDKTVASAGQRRPTESREAAVEEQASTS
jgi:class 3 adenylate cyclase/tetratricopeptide (TPR) repeat protein